MSSFDPMAAAIDWLDAYRAASIPDILNLYDASAYLECGCGGRKIIVGKTAMAAYWHQRFNERPASELTNLQMIGDAVIVSYRVPVGVVEAQLEFSKTGKISRSVCGPSSCENDLDFGSQE